MECDLKMSLEQFLNMTLREVLDTYCAIYSLECGYHYGVSTFDTVEEIIREYNVLDEYPEAFAIENIISDEVIDSMENGLLSYEKLEVIMDNLGINKNVKEE